MRVGLKSKSIPLGKITRGHEEGVQLCNLNSARTHLRDKMLVRLETSVNRNPEVCYGPFKGNSVMSKRNVVFSK